MSTTADYTPEELTTLAAAVMLSGMAVSMVDVGVVSTAIEANAMAQEVAGAAKKYPHNEQGLKIEVRPEEMKPETAVNTAVDRINAAITILSAKATPDEIQEYKEFIYACADRVANAAGSGLFGGGEKVSSQEAAALDRLKVALAL
jgi:hypothetical protein